jgi:superfamily II DNA or RNA helicase
MCILYPGIIKKNGLTSFEILNGPFIWELMNKIKLNNKIEINLNWKIINDKNNRKLYEHQEDALERMINRKKNGKNINLLYISPGMGKTYIVLSYVKWLIENNLMPEYFIYTLPPSASETIIKECDMIGLNYNLLDFTINSKNKEIKPNLVNIIKHDHLRLNDKKLKEMAHKMLFVVDEFHKTLNTSIRTSIALELVKNSAEVIGLSGTIVQNDNIKILIPWLEQITEFEVNEKNYYVAIGSMISKKVYTKVYIDRINYNDTNIKFDETNEKIYYNLN